MDLHIVTLEITNLIIAFDHYDHLLISLTNKDTDLADEQQKIRRKNNDHLTIFLRDASFYTADRQLIALTAIKEIISIKLTSLKSKEIHELVELLEKDVKKIKKLYKAVA